MDASVDRHVEVFIGPFGSGKTEVAINRARYLAAGGDPVALVDLDVVDPFFRARQARRALAAYGVALVSPPEPWDSADLPLLAPGAFAALAGAGTVLVDVGGEPQGAIILRQMVHLLPSGTPVYLVVNPFRPAMRMPEAIVQTCAVIEDAAGVPVTALVSNPHLGPATTPDLIRAGHAVVVEAASRLRRPVAWLAIHETFAGAVRAGVTVLPLRLHMTPPWEDAPLPARTVVRGGRARA